LIELNQPVATSTVLVQKSKSSDWLNVSSAKEAALCVRWDICVWPDQSWSRRDGDLSPLTYGADSGGRPSDAGGGGAVLHGAGEAQLGGGGGGSDLWGSWGGVG